MPIMIPDGLPAAAILQREGVRIINESTARRQDIRPLRIALLNLMPEKIPTETQFSRLLGAGPLQVELTLLMTGSYKPKHTAAAHLQTFYRPWPEVENKGERFDGLIVTGAPVEQMPFEEVDYWPELVAIFNWARTHVFRTLAVCWGAQAALYHRYRIDKYPLPDGKLVGLYRHHIVEHSPLTAGLSDTLAIPISRYTGNERAALTGHRDVTLVLDSPEIGPCLVTDRAHNVYIFNHLEYDADTLDREYQRDCERLKKIGEPISNAAKPAHYYTSDDRMPDNTWRSSASVIFANWIHDIYQHVPFDPSQIGQDDLAVHDS